MSMKRAIIYTRLSKDRPEERSRADQEADCTALCRAKGFEVLAVHTDLESGYRRTARRPGYEALLRDVQAGSTDAVVIWKLDRLTRQGIRQIAPLLEVLEQSGTILLSVHDPIDTSTAMGEGTLGLLASVAKQESENISVRTRRAKLHHAEKGRHKDGGPRPFGLTRDWSAVVPEEARLIRSAAERVLTGDSLRSIVMEWNRQGVVTSTGRSWSTQALRTLLLQRRLYGVREHDGRVVAKGTWPAILDETTSRRLSAVLTDPRRRSGRPAHSYLLTGFLRCSKCGGRMRSTHPSGGKRKYTCPPKPEGCNGIAILADDAEREVGAQVLIAMDSPRLREPLDDDDGGGEEFALAIAADEMKLEELAQDWAANRITRPEWLAARDAVQARLEQSRRRLAEIAVKLPLIQEDLSGRWEDLTFDEKRQVLGVVVDSIIVMPATRGRHFFDPERLSIKWRF
jgi:site-specific DNA recombinase